MGSKVHVYQGDAVGMNVSAVRTSKHCERFVLGCERGMSVPNETFDVLNVGFGLFPPFPHSLLRTVRTGGFLLIPACFQSDGSQYCNEKLTLYRKQTNGNVTEVQNMSISVESPRIPGKFVVVSR